MQETKPEIASEEEDDDVGPPPGFQCIITPPPPQPPAAEAEEAEADDEDDGPPPGFGSLAPRPPQSVPSSDVARNRIEDDEDGPPPGWEFSTLANALPKPRSNTTDIELGNKGELNDDDGEDEGPPPGWEMVLPHQMAPQRTPSLQPSSTVSFDTEMGSKQKITRNDDETPPSVTQSTPPPGQSSPPTPPPQQLQSLELPGGNKVEDKKNGDKRPTSGHQHASPLQKLPTTQSPSAPTPAPSDAEKAQLVCGTCRKLCLYPRGAKWVQCPGCQEVNFVLEEHEVGQVKCGGCSVLLMYPHGAPAVQCSSCCVVTEIGAQNRRPPLSVQQSQRRRRRFIRTR